jgi:hypothetical protein
VQTAGLRKDIQGLKEALGKRQIDNRPLEDLTDRELLDIINEGLEHPFKSVDDITEKDLLKIVNGELE